MPKQKLRTARRAVHIFIVVCRLGSKANSQTKMAIQRWDETGMGMCPGRAYSLVSRLGMWLPWSSIPSFNSWGCVSQAQWFTIWFSGFTVTQCQHMEFLLHNVIRLLQIPASTVLCLHQRSKCDHNMTWSDPYQRIVTGCHPTGYTGRQATSTAAMSPACGPQKLSEMIISTSVTVRSIHDLHHCMATCVRHFDHNPLVWTLTKQTHACMSLSKKESQCKVKVKSCEVKV